MKKFINKIAKAFKNKNRNNINVICSRADGELRSYCENEKIYIK